MFDLLAGYRQYTQSVHITLATRIETKEEIMENPLGEKSEKEKWVSVATAGKFSGSGDEGFEEFFFSF